MNSFLWNGVLWLCIFSVGFSATIIVDTTGTEGDSLQAAIDSTLNLPGIDTVLVQPGTYHLFINDTVGLIMRDSVVLLNNSGSATCTLTAVSESGIDTAWHVIYCDTLTFPDSASHCAEINGFTLINGNARGTDSHSEGGAIYCRNASISIVNNFIYNNASDYTGGAISIYNANLLTSNNTFRNNSSQYGGAIYCEDCYCPQFISNVFDSNYASERAGGLRLYNCDTGYIYNNQFLYNQANEGGALGFHTNCKVYVYENTFRNNSASSYGGAISVTNNAEPRIIKNTIVNNSAHDGGFMYCYSWSDPLVQDNLIVNNTAYSGYYGGGGVYAYKNGTISFIRNTIKNNRTTHKGGFCHAREYDVTSENNIIVDNRAIGDGGFIYTNNSSYTRFIKDVVINNVSKSYSGGAFAYYDPYGSHRIDSCFIVDNGAYYQNACFWTPSSPSPTNNITCHYTHLYYNTYQDDIEVRLAYAVGTFNWENNFWFTTDSATIDSLIYGDVSFIPYETTFITGVPREPILVDSVRNYTDSTYSVICDSVSNDDTLFLRIYGVDANPDMREAGVVILTSSIYPTGIAVALAETDTNSGIYQGTALVKYRTDTDSIRIDDIYQRIGVDITDTIAIIAQTDTFYVKVGMEIGVSEYSEGHCPIGLYLSKTVTNKDISFSYSLKQTQLVEIALFDITGRMIKTLKQHQPKGNHKLSWNCNELPSGVYFLMVRVDDDAIVRKFIKVK